ncbi:MAG TPA: phosphoribosyl-AMP cyclohydrolase [Mariprofundaceae bacterium]|nr:phosphoribosyl-AMP cyclohydrolase [Mariprofundaceae bacterium]
MSLLNDIKFNEAGLVPAIAQDASSGRVLMMAWMNAAAVEQTLATGYAHYYSRSRQKQWKKGESSGHVQKVVDIFLDCDGDTLLLKVEQTGPACHTNRQSCFYRQLDGDHWQIIEAPQL